MNLDKLKNKDYIVLLPDCDNDIKDGVTYSFDNVYMIDDTYKDEKIEEIIDFVNNVAKSLVLFDYDDIYRKILPYIRKNKKIRWVIKHNVSYMTQGAIRATYFNLMEFYDRNIVDVIGCLDKSTYEVLNNAGYNAKYINLDIKKLRKSNKNSNSIGLIGDDFNPNHNTYNELSSIKLIKKYSYIKTIKHMPATEHFINFFGIKDKKVSSYIEVMKDNFVNLYCNFTANNNELILKSMDMGIPCILGNTDIFDKYPKLKKFLVLKSDDDISEIANKIDSVKENREVIIKEYEKFRKKYSEESKKNIIKFLK